jgi:hypothetical protein
MEQHKEQHSEQSSQEKQNGGQVTISPPISPPSKVKIDNTSIQILASGIDTLNLAIDVFWSNSDLFEYLATLKSIAKEIGVDAPGFFHLENHNRKWPFTVKPHGTNGYEWILYNKELTFKIGSWTKPQSRPSVLVEIRSETLWHLGAEKTVSAIVQILQSQGGTRISLKPSRVDLCVDALLLAEEWNNNLIEYAITRSTGKANYLSHNKLTGISIGRGKISARLYDKPLEISQKSKKFWMFDIWGIAEVPENRKIIRVEFQLRRELLTQLAINDIQDLFLHCDNLWAYCRQKWLKFQTNPEKHHTQRKTFDWWQEIQNGFLGVQNPTPLIRSKSIHIDLEQSTIQAIGYLKAIIAARIAGHELDEYVPAEVEDGLAPILKKINRSESSQAEFAESIRAKISKNHRTLYRHIEVQDERKKLGFPQQN